METVFTVNGYSDYDIPTVRGIFTSFDIARRAIKRRALKDQENLKEVEWGKFKRTKSIDGEDYHIWIEEVKLDKGL